MLEAIGVREELLALLRGGNAHMPFDEAVADFPTESINVRPPHVTYTPWQLLEHMRLAQRDILEFITNPAYQELRWPDDYWPQPGTQAAPAQWQQTLAAFRADATAIEA